MNARYKETFQLVARERGGGGAKRAIFYSDRQITVFVCAALFLNKRHLHTRQHEYASEVQNHGSVRTTDHIHLHIQTVSQMYNSIK